MDIYKMALHETITVNSIEITRVPGGWLYNSYTFVPLHNEFANRTDKTKVYKDIVIPPDIAVSDPEILKDKRIRDQFTQKYWMLSAEIILNEMITWITKNKHTQKVKSKKHWVSFADKWFLQEQKRQSENKTSVKTDTSNYSPT